ncbi:MAG TPA: hypothetical protein VGJ81_19785 [Thermoanaerobaculia bacterium]
MKFWSDILVMVAAAATFVFGSIALYTGNKIADRQAQQLVRLDHDLTEAKSALEQQRERAANAERQTAEAQQEIAQTTANLDIATSEWRQRAAVAELELAEFKKRIRDRHIESVDRARLLDALRKGAGNARVRFIDSADQEPRRFATEVAEVLTDAGWKVHFDQSQLLDPSIAPGLTLRAASNSSEAKILIRAFSGIGIRLHVEAPASEGAVLLSVGAKPQPK